MQKLNSFAVFGSSRFVTRERYTHAECIYITNLSSKFLVPPSINREHDSKVLALLNLLQCYCRSLIAYIDMSFWKYMIPRSLVLIFIPVWLHAVEN